MSTRKEIEDRIEAYAAAVRDRSPRAVSELFAERFDHIVHGAGSDPDNPWNTKSETDREGIRRIYEDFFANVADMPAVAMSFRSMGKDIGSANLNLVNSSLKGLTPLPDLDEITSLLKQCRFGNIDVHRFMPGSTFCGIVACNS